MRFYFLFAVIAIFLITAVCPALTVFQTWDVDDWAKSVQPDNLINVRPNGLSYCSVTPIHRNALPGYSGVNTSIGTFVPAMTYGGNVPECWMQYDYRYDGEGTQYSCFVGLYYSGVSNDASAGASNWIGVSSGGQNVQCAVVGSNPAGAVTYPYMANIDFNIIERVKMHVYTYDSNTVMDVEVYIYDPKTDTASLTYTFNKFLVLANNQYFAYDIDCFGFRNSRGSFQASTINNYSFDNMYFSTDGPKLDAVPVPSFAAICNRKSGDYNNDCDVDFKDLAIMGDEWLQIGMIPERVFQWQQE